MKIKIGLSDYELRAVVSTLAQAKINLENGVEQTLAILTKNGAMEAQAAYGSMAVVDYDSDATMGLIGTSGDVGIIAEFGAGDATLDPSPLFENLPSTPVYPGSYSEVHAKQYADYGRWEFPPGSGNWMTEVQPRMGLFHAKEYILAEGINVAKGAISL